MTDDLTSPQGSGGHQSYSIHSIGEYTETELQNIPNDKLADLHLELDDHIDDLSEQLSSATGRANTLLGTALGLGLTAYITFFVAGMNWTVSSVLGSHPPKDPDGAMRNDVQAGGWIALDMAAIVLAAALIVWWFVGRNAERKRQGDLRTARRNMRVIKGEERRRQAPSLPPSVPDTTRSLTSRPGGKSPMGQGESPLSLPRKDE